MRQPAPSPAFGTVAVVGASIAGLLAARVLTDHARQVVLVERDELRAHIATDAAAPRKGVPQGGHAHSLLAGGQQAIEALFPGLSATLRAAGADTGGGAFFSSGGYLEAAAGSGSLFASRGLLEAELRRRVLALPGVRLIDAAQAEPPRLEGGRVVCLDLHRLDGRGRESLATELVVDASGRGSRTPAWLAARGLAAPPVERVEVGMRYASRHVRRRSGDLAGRCFFAVTPTPALPRACGILAQEGGRWIVTLIGYFGDQPAANDAGFLAFARTLPAPEPAVLLTQAEPLDEIRTTSFPANVRVRYEQLAAPPQGLLVIGDALAAFSPVYGQGMSVAALQAQALQRALVLGRGGLERRFFDAAARVIDTPWLLAVGNDRQLAPGGPHGTLPQRLRARWVRRVIRAGHHDAQVAEAFLRVARLLDPPAALLRPALVARVLRVRQALHGSRGGAEGPATAKGLGTRAPLP